MPFYPFFMKCSIAEENETISHQFKNLSFGIGGLIFSRGDAYFLSLGEEEFRVPTDYNDDARIQLKQMMIDSDYYNINLQLFQQTMCQPRKADKLRSLTECVLKKNEPIEKSREMYTLLVVAFFLKIIESYTGDNMDVIINKMRVITHKDF